VPVLSDCFQQIVMTFEVVRGPRRAEGPFDLGKGWYGCEEYVKLSPCVCDFSDQSRLIVYRVMHVCVTMTNTQAGLV